MKASMHIVAVHSWQQEEADVTKIIADTLGILPFEARQKIAGGDPTVIASFADPHQAQMMAAKLSLGGVPALVIDTLEVRSRRQLFSVSRFELRPQVLKIELLSGEVFDIDYGTIDLLLVATCSSGQIQTTDTVTTRKFSIGKTLLAGGIPMSKKVKTEVIKTSEERDQTLWLYVRQQKTFVFNRAALNYTGLGDAMQMSCDLNFNYLKNELQRLAPQANYDDRLLKRPGLTHLLGQPLSLDTDLDLAFEVLASCLNPSTLSAEE